MDHEELKQYCESLSISSREFFADGVLTIVLPGILYLIKSTAIFGGIYWASQYIGNYGSRSIMLFVFGLWITITVLTGWVSLRRILLIKSLNVNLVWAVETLSNSEKKESHVWAAMVLHDAIRELLDSVVKSKNNKHAEFQGYSCLSYLDSTFKLNYWSTQANADWLIAHPIENT